MENVDVRTEFTRKHDHLGKELYRLGEIIHSSKDKAEAMQRLNGHIRGIKNSSLLTPTRQRRVHLLEELIATYK